MSKMEEINEICERSFKTHKATLIQNTDRYLAIDWRRADGSGDYYVNYIVDKKRGSLIVSGDLGDSIATWYNPIDPSDLKKYIKNTDYYIGKFQCTSNLYNYDIDNVIEDIKEELDDYSVEQYVELSGRFDSVEEFWEYIEDEVENSICDKFIPSQDLRDIIDEFDVDCFEWLHTCGRRINMRVYLWAEGFRMACEQLGI